MFSVSFDYRSRSRSPSRIHKKHKKHKKHKQKKVADGELDNVHEMDLDKVNSDTTTNTATVPTPPINSDLDKVTADTISATP